MLLPLLAVAAVASTAAPGNVMIFRDWAVGCDNRRWCQAVGLQETSGQKLALMGIQTMYLGSTWEAAALSQFPAYVTTVEIRVDNDILRGRTPVAILAGGLRIPLSKPLDLRGDGESTIEIDTEYSDTLLRKLISVESALLVDASGKEIIGVSLRGLREALDHIDHEQSRVGAVNAFVSPGPAPASKWYQTPPIRTELPYPDDLQTEPSEEQLVQARTDEIIRRQEAGGKGCRARPEDEGLAQRLDQRFSVYLIPVSCQNQPDQNSAAVLLVDDAAAGQFIRPSLEGQPPDGMNENVIYNGYYKSEGPNQYDENGLSFLFSSFRGTDEAKPCRIEQEYSWDGAEFRLLYQSEMPSCRESYGLIRTWTTDFPPSPATDEEAEDGDSQNSDNASDGLTPEQAERILRALVRP